MFDLLMLMLLTVAFAAAAGYVWACDDLTKPVSPAEDQAP